MHKTIQFLRLLHFLHGAPDNYVYELLDFSNVKPGTKLPKHEHYSARSYKLGTLYGPVVLQEEIERFNRIMKKIEVEGTFTSDISIDVADLSKNIKEENVQPTGVPSVETACETVVSSVEVEVEEQEIEYAPAHKKSDSPEENVKEEIVKPVTHRLRTFRRKWYHL